MLNVYFGKMPEAIYNTAVYFKNSYRDSWITSELGVAMIKDVDKSDVVSASLIQSPVLGPISPLQLSGGVKTLLLRSGPIKDDSLSQILANPGNYIESAEFFSWEQQFFADYLRSAAKETPFAYQKWRIAVAYLLSDNASKVMALIACGNVA